MAGFRHLLFALLFCLTYASQGLAQPWAEKLFKEGVVHDFGTVPRGAQLFHRFTLTNIYAVKLEITNLRSGCGCVSASCPVKVLEPRETTTIDVSMDARRFTGQKSVIVYVTVGPEFVSTAELRVSGNCRSDVVFNPGQVSFGTVAKGQKTDRSVEVEYAGAQDWKITELVSKDLPVDAILKETYRRPGQVGYEVQVTLKPGAASGSFKDFLYLKTNDSTTPLLAVLVEGVIQSSLTVSPQLLSLGSIKQDEPLTRRVVVRGNKPFLVLGVDGLGDGIELGSPPSTTPAEVQTVTFKCTRKLAGDFRKELKIKTDLQETPLTVTIEGTAGPGS
ncbi:MAG: DUF1573 domain-containing protein [Gemmataceae bacterium]|nr:DUF1573 domain-containing protein [Gemmataceae bacterium]